MSRHNNSATAYIVERALRGARRLKACVAAFIDDVADRLVSRQASRALVTVAGGRADLHVPGRNGEARHVAGITGDIAVAAAHFRKQLSARQRQAVALRLGAERALISPLSLPQGVADVLPAVIRNKIESLGPWPLDETVWGYRVAGPPRDGQIAVDVALTSRRKLDELLRPLESAGLRIGRIDARDADHGKPVIAFDYRDARRRLRMRRIVIVAIAALFALPLAAASHGGYRLLAARGELASADERIAALELGLRGGGPAASPQLARANELHTRKRDVPSFVALLAGLSELLPDQVWLETLVYENDGVTISGRGTGVPKLIETLESSRLFKDVNFAAAIQHDEAGNVDTFSIAAGVEATGGLK